MTPVEATLEAPATAPAGSNLQIGWTGPDYERDYVSVAAVGERDGAYINYTYTRDGTPLTLPMPPLPGDYELRYVVGQDNTVMVRQPITLTPVEATLEAPATAPAGSNLQIGWTGPDYERDYVSVAAVGERDGAYVNYTYTSDGTPLTLPMPASAGRLRTALCGGAGQYRHGPAADHRDPGRGDAGGPGRSAPPVPRCRSAGPVRDMIATMSRSPRWVNGMVPISAMPTSATATRCPCRCRRCRARMSCAMSSIRMRRCWSARR